MVTEQDRMRTLAIARQLAQGKQMKVRGHIIAMTPDMLIGILYNGGVSEMASMDLRGLNAFLTEHGVGPPIPSTKS